MGEKYSERVFEEEPSLQELILSLSKTYERKLWDLVVLHGKVVDKSPVALSIKIHVEDMKDLLYLAEDLDSPAILKLPFYDSNKYAPMECPLERAKSDLSKITNKSSYPTIWKMINNSLGKYSEEDTWEDEEVLIERLVEVCMISLERFYGDSRNKKTYNILEGCYDKLLEIGVVSEEEVEIYTKSKFVKTLCRESAINFKIIEDKPAHLEQFVTNWLNKLQPTNT